MATKKVDMGHVTPHCVQMMYNDVFVALFAHLMEDFGIKAILGIFRPIAR